MLASPAVDGLVVVLDAEISSPVALATPASAVVCAAVVPLPSFSFGDVARVVALEDVTSWASLVALDVARRPDVGSAIDAEVAVPAAIVEFVDALRV